MPEATINYWAILAGIVANMIIGYIWYSRPVFGNSWMRLIGKTEDQLKGGAGKAMGMMIVVAFILGFVFSHFIDYTEATTITSGIITALWIWIGFVFTTKAADYLFSQKPLKLFMIDTGYHLVSMVVMGAILAVWQ